ncbi:MAG: hypothetical protein HY728_10425 [Candidatus Rokubacteria bacterium]|nr:hypothetical protein [Candidatus Rokubacteria bacterium]
MNTVRYAAGLVGLLALAVVSAAPAGAQNFAAPAGEDLRVEWAVAAPATTPPVVEGYVSNTAGWWARRLRLTVEALDASGRVLERTIISVLGELPPGGRLYFSATLGTVTATYRISVQSFDRTDPGQT